MRILIIGGVAAGTSAAAKASRTTGDAEIVILEKGEDISYAGCGLPYYISGLVAERERVVINTPEEFGHKYGVDVRTGREVTEIIPEKSKVKYRVLDQGTEKEYQYDKLIITTGARPVVPPIEGVELNGVVTLRSAADADRIKQLLSEYSRQRVVIVGAGLIGLEMAEAFSQLGLEVIVVEKAPHVLPPFSQEIAAVVEDYLTNKNVKLILDDGVAKFSGKEKLEKVITEKGEEIETGLALMAVGIRPVTDLASSAGIKLGPTGAIAINKRMETSHQNIYAAGDCAESVDLITGEPVWVPLGSTANKQGRTAGENAAGGRAEHKGILKTSITRVFDLGIARTGIAMNEAAENGFDPVAVQIKSVNHAGYYPGRKALHLRGIFDRESHRLLGAEVAGEDGADKRIDVLSTAIYGGLNLEDLFQVDLAYAPPYSIPKDPVAVLGMVAEKRIK